MDFPQPLTPEEVRRRKGRNRLVAWCLVGFIALVFAGSIAKMSQGHLPVLNADIGVKH